MLALPALWLMAGLCPVALRAEGIFNTVRVEGRNYVNVADLVRFYGFDRSWKQEGVNIVLHSKFRRCQFRINNRECWVNGVRIWLNDAPLEARSSLLLSEVDVLKTLDPIFRPWSVRGDAVRTVMIDPGHGGEDHGTQGWRGSQEKQLTLDLAVRVERCLRLAGFQTLMTRRSDTYISLEDRSDLANASRADLLISLHFNSAKPNTHPRGVETYCLTPVGLSSTGSIRRRFGIGDFGEEPGNHFDRNNVLLAYLVQQRIIGTLKGVEDRGIKRARFYVIKATERPSILVEGGFLSNPQEEQRLLTAEHRDRLAGAIVKGVQQYAAALAAGQH